MQLTPSSWKNSKWLIKTCSYRLLIIAQSPVVQVKQTQLQQDIAQLNISEGSYTRKNSKCTKRRILESINCNHKNNKNEDFVQLWTTFFLKTNAENCSWDKTYVFETYLQMIKLLHYTKVCTREFSPAWFMLCKPSNMHFIYY
jgi:hypothetical protein